MFVYVDIVVDCVNLVEYIGLVLLGGVMNFDKFCWYLYVIDFIKGFVELGKLIVVICYVFWLFIEVDLVNGCIVIFFEFICIDLENVGVNWVD